MPLDLSEAWSRIRTRRWVHVAAIVLALVLAGNLVFAFLTLDPGAWRTLRSVSPAFLALGIVLTLVPMLTNTLRIWIWARFAGGKIGIRDTFQITLASDLGAAFTPTAAGGGAVRLAMLLGHGLPAGRASAVLVLTTVEDAIFFAVFLPLGILLASGTDGSSVRGILARAGERAGLVLAGALLLGLFLTFAWRRHSGRVKERVGPRPHLRAMLQRGIGWWRQARGVFAQVLRRGKLRAVCSLSLTAVQWISRYSVIAALLAAFGLEAAPLTHILLQWVVFTAGTLVPTPGGATAMESAFAVVYHPFVPGPLLGTVTVLWRVLLFYLPLALDVVLLGAFVLGRRPTLNGRTRDRTADPPPPPPKTSSRPRPAGSPGC